MMHFYRNYIAVFSIKRKEDWLCWYIFDKSSKNLVQLIL